MQRGDGPAIQISHVFFRECVGKSTQSASFTPSGEERRSCIERGFDPSDHAAFVHVTGVHFRGFLTSQRSTHRRAFAIPRAYPGCIDFGAVAEFVRCALREIPDRSLTKLRRSRSRWPNGSDGCKRDAPIQTLQSNRLSARCSSCSAG